MLNKKKLSFRIDCMIFAIFAFLIAIFISLYQNNKFDAYYQNLLKEAIENINSDSLYFSESIRIIENEVETNINKSYLYNDGYVIERSTNNTEQVSRKYIGNKVYTYKDNAWYKETGKYKMPDKINIKYEDFDGIKVMSNIFYFGLEKEPVEYICHVKDSEKEKYLRDETLKGRKEDLYIMLTCNSGKLTNLSFTQINNNNTVDYNASISAVTSDMMISIPEYDVDLDMIEKVYGEADVDNAEKVPLYNNYQKLIGSITVPAGFKYDEEISSKSEIYLDETDGYGEIIIKGKCDGIIEKLLTDNQYEENSIKYGLEHLFTVETKTGNVDMYRYTVDKGDLGKTEDYVGLTCLDDEIIEILFEDTKLEFNQENISTLINYIM